MAAPKAKIGKVIGIVFAVFVVMGIIGSMGNRRPEYSAESTRSQTSTQEADSSAVSSEGEQETGASAEEAPKYVITEEAVDASNPFGVKITGKLTNNSGHDVSYIQVEYVVYDAEGNQVGTGWDNTSNLKDGGTWKFEAFTTVAPEEFGSFELADVTGF